VMRFDAARCPSAVLMELEIGLLIDDAVGRAPPKEPPQTPREPPRLPN